jgi:hypothetical protein
MNQEKFVSSYIELLNDTITDAFQKNLVMQVQKKVTEDELEELKNYVKNIKNSSDSTLSKNEQEIIILKEQLNEERRQRQLAMIEVEELRKNNHHIETFKNQLLQVRNENTNLISEIEKKNSILRLNEDEIKKLKELDKKLRLEFEDEIRKIKEIKENKEVEENSKRTLKKKDNISSIVKKERTEEIIKDAGNF